MYKPALNKTNSTYGLEYFTSFKEMKRNTNLRVITTTPCRLWHLDLWCRRESLQTTELNSSLVLQRLLTLPR